MLDGELARNASERSTNVNPVGQAVQQDIALNRTKLQGFEALVSAMNREFQQYQVRLDEIEGNAFRLQQFERQRQAAEQSLAAYEKQYENARANDRLNELRLVNVTAIEPVRAGAEPVKPRRWLLMKLALSLGLLLSAGFAFLLELLDQRVRNERDIELDLGVPVLATLAYNREVRV